MQSIKYRSTLISKTDKALALFGFLGFMLWIWQYPQQHLDGAVTFPKDKTFVLNAAQNFLKQFGYATHPYEFSANYEKEPKLWQDIQEVLGREAAVSVLKTHIQEQFPVFYWRVSACKSEDIYQAQNESAEALGPKCPMTLFLSPKGKVWKFENRGGENPEINTITQPNNSYFNFPKTLSGESLQQALYRKSNKMPAQAISVHKALQSAQYHLNALSFFQNVHFKADSISIKNNIATIFFQTDDSFFGIRRTVWIRLTPDLALNSLDVRFKPLVLQPPAFWEMAKNAFYLVFWGIGILIFTIVFFKRLQQKSIDLSTAIRDASWAGLFLFAFLILLLSKQFSTQTPPLQTLTIIGIGALFGGCGGALLVFLVSGATDGLSRTFMPDKLVALNLVRRFHIRNHPVGAALLRGIFGAALLLGIITILLWLIQPLHLSNDPGIGGDFPSLEFLQPYFGIGSITVFNLFLFFWMVYLGFGAWLYQWKGKYALIIGCAILYALFNLHSLSLVPWIGHLCVAAIVGAFLAWLLWRFDIFTAGVAHVIYTVTLYLSVGWMSPNMPEGIDIFLLALTVLGLFCFGFYGVFWGKMPNEVETYVPRYITEFAQEERIRRDLEIARNIQLSFLPQKMPTLKGAEIAATCLTAQQVGGDYFDFIPLNEHKLAVIIGDVSGKGIPAALYMTLTKGFVQTLSRETDNPAEVLKRLNNLFCLNANKGTFISLIYGILDTQRNTFTFARAGHNPVILKKANRNEASSFLPQGIAVGLTRGETFNQAIQNNTLYLQTNDVLLLYTDGLSEAMNKDRFQLTDKKVAQLLAANAHHPIETICNNLLAERQRFSGKDIPEDDCTLIVLKIIAT